MVSRCCRVYIALFLGLAFCCPIFSQEFRKTPGHDASPAESLTKRAVERRFLSKSPQPQWFPDKTLAGRTLLDARRARAQQVKERASAASRLGRFATSPAAAFYPGIQYRGTTSTGIIPTSVVSGDFNGDGHMDFVVANGYTSDLWMYLGNGDGTFQLPQIVPLSRGLSPLYLQAADLRGIGILDLVVAEFDTNTVGVLLGKGDGSFGFEQTYTLPQPPAAIVVDDFNRDHKADIVAVMFTLSSDTQGVDYIATLFGDGTGQFASPIITRNWGFYGSAWNITSGDVNNDGLPDLLITGPALDNSQVYLNAGDGTFTAGQILAESGPFNAVVDAKFGDLNEDGCLDAAIADLGGMVWVVFGDCAGNFSAIQSVQMADSNSAIRLVDANGDGHLDLVTSSIGVIDPIYGDVAGDTLSIALGDGHGNFTLGRNYVGTGQAYSLTVADFNGDHHPDVVTVGNDTDTANVFLNDGTANFGFPQGLFVGLPGVGVINAPLSPPYFADLNHDGKPDVLLLDEGYNGEYFTAVMLNDGTGRFSPPVVSDTGITIIGDWIGDFKLGDFRNTGNLDLVAVGLNGAYSTAASFILFMPGKGDGTFGASTLTSVAGASGEMAIGDFNSDGKLDFVAVSSGAGGGNKQLTTFLGNGDGTFRTGATLGFSDSSQDLVRFFAGDFNRDGKLDVLVYDTGNGYWTTASYVWEFLGNGDGTFQPGRQLFTAFQPMTVADINGDHWLDIVRYDFFWPDGTTETQGPAKFTNYLDNGDGTFSQISSYAPYGGSPLTTGPYLQLGDPTAVAMVSDLNGDGKADEVAVQSTISGNRILYAQMLMGMGDGTFTPTYDIFTNYKPYGFPMYAHDLDGNGSADVIELDQSISSMHVLKSAPAPAIQLALEEEQLQGTTSCGWIFPNVPISSDRQVSLSSSVGGVSLPPSVTIPAGALSQQFCYSLDNTFNWRNVFDIRAQLGSDVAIAYASSAYTFGFGETLAPTAQQVFYPSQSSTPITVTLTSSQGYGSTVHLSCDSLAAGSSCQFASNTLVLPPSGTVSTTVVINTTAAAQYGGTISVVADDGQVAKRQPFTYVVQPLMLDLFGYLRGTPSTSVAADLLVYGLPPYSPSCSGLPAGAACSFSGQQLNWPSSTDLAVTVSIPSGTPAADYPFTIAVQSGSIVSTTTATLSVIDFAFQGAPSLNWIPPGGSVQSAITLQALNQFNLNVNITCSLSAGGTCTGSTAYGAAIGSTLNIAVPAGTAPGNYTLTVTVTVGSLSHTAQFPFVVADYSGSLSANAITIAGGGTGSVKATVNATDGFAGTVSLSCNSSPVVCTFSPQSLNPTGGSAATAIVNMTAAYASRASESGRSGAILALALLPLGLVAICACRKVQSAIIAALALPILLVFTLACGGSSSGGKGGGGGGGGSNTYSVQVIATVSQANTTRTLGTVQVTVTH